LTRQPGTAHYSAPEIFEAADYDQKVDGFSFGSVLYEIITRKPVFPRELARLRVMIKLIVLQLPEPLEDWTPTLADLLRRCWRGIRLPAGEENKGFPLPIATAVVALVLVSGAAILSRHFRPQ
jgi:hypothetical protein